MPHFSSAELKAFQVESESVFIMKIQLVLHLNLILCLCMVQCIYLAYILALAHGKKYTTDARNIIACIPCQRHEIFLLIFVGDDIDS